MATHRTTVGEEGRYPTDIRDLSPTELAAHPALTGSYAGLGKDVALSGYNLKSSSFRRWAAAVARGRTGGAVARLDCKGDSITYGHPQTDPLQTKSYPDRLRSLLNGTPRYGTVYEGLVWLQYNASSPSSITDTRVTIGAGWTITGGAGPGGRMGFTNTTTVNPITFGPVTCDSFTVYYRKGTGLNVFSTAIDGGAATNQANASNGGVNSYGSVTVAAGTPGSPAAHTLTVANVTGASIYAIEYGDSTRATPGVAVSRCGNQGATTGGWADATAGIGSLPTAFDMVTPDLTCLMLISNDYATQVAPATSQANLLSIVQKAQAKNGDVLLIVPPPPQAGLTIPFSQYVAAHYAVADATGSALLDFSARWVSYEVSNLSPYSLYADNYHPSNAGYQDIPTAVAQILLSV